jgi:tight adherence protein B
VVISLVLLATAFLCWPAKPGAVRLRGLVPAGARSRRRVRLPRPTTAMISLGLGSLGWLAGGFGGAIACALGAATAWRRWTVRRTTRQTLSAIDGLAEAVRSVVAELRAGAHPAAACESAASDAEPRAARALRALAAAARLDGDLDQALHTSRAANPTTAPVLDQLARAWTLGHRHGLPLAEVLDAVRADLDSRARFARQVLARMAGPRASATILALLPLLGIALGQAMGAHPLHILLATPAGQLLLPVGAALGCAGVAWSAHLTKAVVFR